jgi:seryl-tRNA synthetase
MFKSNPNLTKLTKPQKNAKIPKSVKKTPPKSQKRQLHSSSPKPKLTTRLLSTPKQLFSTTPQEMTETQQTQRPTDQELEEHRSRFKTIVSTMNSDQQMVVQALVAESVMLRGELKNLAFMTQQHQEQAQSVLQQLEEIKASGIVRGGAEQSGEIEE